MNEAPEETGIQDSQTFDAYADTQPQLSLSTQFFTDTFGFFRERISSNLDNREAGAVLTRLTITGPPVPRGDGHYDYDEPDPDQKRKLVITRVALYVPFTARVQSPSKGPEIVQGALTSVIGNVNQPDNRVVRAWMDVDDFQRGRLMTPDTDVYQSRMLSVGEWLPSDFPPGSPERGEAADRPAPDNRDV